MEAVSPAHGPTGKDRILLVDDEEPVFGASRLYRRASATRSVLPSKATRR